MAIAITFGDDGKQPKTFGFDLLILQFLTF